MEQVICVVEDDDGIRDMLEIIFRRKGYEVTSLAAGRPVIEEAFSLPDLYLIDKQLPDVDGLAICRHLKQNFRTSKIPVIIMSAYPNAKDLSVEAGADDFIEKPFQIGDLLTTIKTHISSHAVI